MASKEGHPYRRSSAAPSTTTTSSSSSRAKAHYPKPHPEFVTEFAPSRATKDPVRRATIAADQSTRRPHDSTGAAEFNELKRDPARLYAEVLELRRATRQIESERDAALVQARRYEKEKALLERKTNAYHGHAAQTHQQQPQSGDVKALQKELAQRTKALTQLQAQTTTAAMEELKAERDVLRQQLKTKKAREEEVGEESSLVRSLRATIRDLNDAARQLKEKLDESEASNYALQQERYALQHGTQKKDKNGPQGGIPRHSQSQRHTTQQQQQQQHDTQLAIASPLVTLFSVSPERLDEMSAAELREHITQLQQFCVRDSLANSQSLRDFRDEQLFRKIEDFMETQERMSERIRELQARELSVVCERDALARQLERVSDGGSTQVDTKRSKVIEGQRGEWTDSEEEKVVEEEERRVIAKKKKKRVLEENVSEERTLKRPPIFLNGKRPVKEKKKKKKEEVEKERETEEEEVEEEEREEERVESDDSFVVGSKKKRAIVESESEEERERETRESEEEREREREREIRHERKERRRKERAEREREKQKEEEREKKKGSFLGNLLKKK